MNTKVKLKRVIAAIVPDSTVKAYETWRAGVRLKRFPRRIVDHQYGDMRFRVTIADPTAELWYDRDWEKLAEIELLRDRRLVSGATVFDLGAHQGVVAMLLADEVGKLGQVVAVEALPHNFRIAGDNLELNDVKNVQLVNAAVAEKSGTIRFSSNGQVDKGSSRTVVDVASVTVDALAREFGWPDVLKIDVEGYESYVLDGATDALERRPDLAIEIHAGCGLEDFGSSVGSIVSRIVEMGYIVMWHSEGGDGPTKFTALSDLPSERFFITAWCEADV